MTDNDMDEDIFNKDKIAGYWAAFKVWAADKPVLHKLFGQRKTVCLLRLSGVISESSRLGGKTISYHGYESAIEKAFSKKADAVVLVINSPGGSPGQSALIADHIRRLAVREDRPVYAFVEDVAASGGYWLACAADEIYAKHVSIIGSVGVIAAGFGFQDFIARFGIERRVYTEGDEKGFLDPFQEENPKDIKRLKTIQKDIHEAFIDWVKQRRGDRLDGTDKSLFEGQFWTGHNAQDNGFIDGLSDVKEFVYNTYGDKTRVVDVTPGKKPFWALPFLSGRIEHDTSGMLDELRLQQARSRHGVS